MKSVFRIFVLLLGSFLVHHQTQAQVNVALNKKATQSSNYIISGKGTPSNAVDGNTDGNWQSNSVTHTISEGENNPWWTVDLGEVYDIYKIRIWNRTDCCAERLDNFKILVKSLPAGEPWRGFISGTQRNSCSNPLTFEGKAEGRYVMIQLVNPKGILSLAEVEVYGTKAQSNQPPAGPLNAREGIFFIKARHSDKYISVKNAGNEDGAILWQWAFHGKQQQQFNLENAGNGFFFIKAMHSGKYLSVKNASKENGAEIWQWTYHGKEQQQFAFETAPDGFYYIKARHSGKYLSIKNAEKEDGAILWQWEHHGNAQQQFKLEKVQASGAMIQENHLADEDNLNAFINKGVNFEATEFEVGTAVRYNLSHGPTSFIGNIANHIQGMTVFNDGKLFAVSYSQWNGAPENTDWTGKNSLVIIAGNGIYKENPVPASPTEVSGLQAYGNILAVAWDQSTWFYKVNLCDGSMTHLDHLDIGTTIHNAGGGFVGFTRHKGIYYTAIADYRTNSIKLYSYSSNNIEDTNGKWVSREIEFTKNYTLKKSRITGATSLVSSGSNLYIINMEYGDQNLLDKENEFVRIFKCDPPLGQNRVAVENIADISLPKSVRMSGDPFFLWAGTTHVDKNGRLSIYSCGKVFQELPNSKLRVIRYTAK